MSQGRGRASALSLARATQHSAPQHPLARPCLRTLASSRAGARTWFRFYLAPVLGFSLLERVVSEHRCAVARFAHCTLPCGRPQAVCSVRAQCILIIAAPPPETLAAGGGGEAAAASHGQRGRGRGRAARTARAREWRHTRHARHVRAHGPRAVGADRRQARARCARCALVMTAAGAPAYCVRAAAAGGAAARGGGKGAAARRPRRTAARMARKAANTVRVRARMCARVRIRARARR